MFQCFSLWVIELIVRNYSWRCFCCFFSCFCCRRWWWFYLLCAASFCILNVIMIKHRINTIVCFCLIVTFNRFVISKWTLLLTTIERPMTLAFKSYLMNSTNLQTHWFTDHAWNSWDSKKHKRKMKNQTTIMNTVFYCNYIAITIGL